MVEEDSPPAAIIQAIIPSLSVADGVRHRYIRGFCRRVT